MELRYEDCTLKSRRDVLMRNFKFSEPDLIEIEQEEADDHRRRGSVECDNGKTN